MAKEKKGAGALGIVLLGGVGVGGYFLWKYFKGNGVVNPDGFIISKIAIIQEGEEVQFPRRDTEFDISIIARNRGGETVNGYCEITDTNTQEIVLYEAATAVPSMEIHTFTYTTTMPGTVLNLKIETGRIVDTEKIVDYSWPMQITSQEIRITGVGAEPAISNPGELMEGIIFTENDYASQTVDVLWAYGTFNPSTGVFDISGYIIDEDITFPGLSSYMYRSPFKVTPDTPRTWDLLGVLASDIHFDGTGIVISGQHGLGSIAEDAWTISGVPSGDIQIASVGVTAG